MRQTKDGYTTIVRRKDTRKFSDKKVKVPPGVAVEDLCQTIYTSFIGRAFTLNPNEDGSVSFVLWLENLSPDPPHPMVAPFWPYVVEEEREVKFSRAQLQEFVDFCLASGLVELNPRFVQNAQTSNDNTSDP